ncbi:MAG TPA: hypothetical protein VMQ51_20450 [Candidatus Binatia bacterium]|nr:hypothetical protein [Candidatus Binatia bacterium]
MRLHPWSTAILVGALAAGCASVACTPASVVVERKEERKELRSEFRGMRTSPSGALVEDRREVIVPEYWMLGRDGRWYQLTESQWRAAEPGQTLSLCR